LLIILVIFKYGLTVISPLRDMVGVSFSNCTSYSGHNGNMVIFPSLLC
jgi:hypothetical protein